MARRLIFLALTLAGMACGRPDPCDGVECPLHAVCADLARGPTCLCVSGFVENDGGVCIELAREDAGAADAAGEDH
ncbi:MAG: hypothetical protein ABIJ09_18730 [Pseudomonadota bacterium]